MSRFQPGAVGILGVVPITGTIGIVQSIPLDVDQSRLYQSQSFARDAFVRLRTSQPVTLFDTKLVTGEDTLVWNVETSGSAEGAYQASRSSYVLSVSGSSRAHCIRQTNWSTNYQPGKSLLTMQTYVIDPPMPGIYKCSGRYDPSNGVFLCMSGTNVGVVVRSDVSGTPVDNFVSQSLWNCDTLDGNGPSGITLDWTKNQIFWHDIEWLGVGMVRTGFIIDGEAKLAHIFKHANEIDGVYMRTPNLPLRYEIRNDGTQASSASIEQICGTVISEGGSEPIGIVKHFTTAAGHTDANSTGTNYLVLATRLRNGFTSASIDFIQAEVATAGVNDFFEWTVVHNPTIASSGTLLWVDGTSSAIEYATGSTAQTITGGTNVAGGFGFGKSQTTGEIKNTLRLGAKLDGTRDVLALCCRPVGTSVNIDAWGSIELRELK